MTTQEKINKLDDAIVDVETYLSYGGGKGNGVKKAAIDALNTIGAKDSVVQAVKSVSFVDNNERFQIGGLLSSMDVREESCRVAYRTSVQTVVNILKQERERLIKEQADEEQKKIYDAQMASNKMQKESILWAKIAAWAGIGSAIIGLASIAVSIFLYLCNN